MFGDYASTPLNPMRRNPDIRLNQGISKPNVLGPLADLEQFISRAAEEINATAQADRAVRHHLNAAKAESHLGQQGMALVTGTGKDVRVKVGGIEGILDGESEVKDVKIGQKLPVELQLVDLNSGAVKFQSVEAPGGILGPDQWFIYPK